MNRCPITYEFCGDKRYSNKGLQLLSPKLTTLKDFPYSAPEQRLQAARLMQRMSISGMQPKLSAVLNEATEGFEVVEKGGRYILKPPHHIFLEVCENEAISMQMAALIGIEVPLHGLLYVEDGTLSYFIKRFDRLENGGKLAVEDFAQLAEQPRSTKYNYTIERMIVLIEKYCTFPDIEKKEFFKRLLFSFLIGNEDMHLKNFSLITKDQYTTFSTAYDLLNTTIALGGATEEMALMLDGKRSNFRRKHFMDYLAKGRLQLKEQEINDICHGFAKVLPQWQEAIQHSFLSKKMKETYLNLLKNRYKRLGIR